MGKQKTPPKTRIALDAMGGDHSPEETVKGGVAAARDEGIEVVLVGQEEALQRELAKYGSADPRIDVANATQVVGMDERPVLAIKEKRDSSIVVGMELLRGGEVAAFVSAGNTGAVMTAACLILGKRKGIHRPALGAVFPFHTGPVLCLDLGANAECKAGWLVQFANMGSIFMEKVFNIENPRVALLSSGEEDTKGSAEVQKANKMLRKARVNFIGNIEGRHIASGIADVIVTDGFTGNVVMKLGEGIGEMLVGSLWKTVAENPSLKPAADLLEPTFRSVIGTLDYRQYGGALLFGVNHEVIVAHGRSDARAIKSAMVAARRSVTLGLAETIKG